jgi:hypothetical protein
MQERTMNLTPMTEWRIMDTDEFETQAQIQELKIMYVKTRKSIVNAIEQLKNIESEYGFEYPEEIKALKELAEQLKVDQQMGTYFIESISE